MASEWTTEDVRHIVMDSETFRLQDALAAKFDAWLAMHDAEVRAKALEDAADAYEALPEGERTYFPGIHAGWLRARAERGEA
jgi:hypothetical protein